MINKCLPRKKGQEGGVQDALTHSFPTENEGLVHEAFSASQSGPARELEPSLRPRYCPPGGPVHLGVLLTWGYCLPGGTAPTGYCPHGYCQPGDTVTHNSLQLSHFCLG